MAYNVGFNPDALPPHAEPDQAAQILAQQSQHIPQKPLSRPHTNSNSSTPSPYAAPASSYHNKPPPPIPPLPQNLQQAQPQHRRPSPSNSNLHSSYTSPNPSRPFSPPQNHNHATPQNHNYGNQPYYQSGRSPPPPRPPTTLPPSGDASLFPLFRAVDKRGTGQLTEEELRVALVNGDFTNFDSHTVRMMIRMFDADRSGTIGFEEFCGLWSFLAAWRALFDGFDEDRSGTISYEEYSKALIAFGYHLSSSFVTMLYRQYDKKAMNSMSFDMFVQSCISLKRMTDIFKKYDTDRDGYITLSFEEFLMEILQQR